eukprot:scaffold25875_cov34-Tisochrysis_lutea.AAC.2
MKLLSHLGQFSRGLNTCSANSLNEDVSHRSLTNARVSPAALESTKRSESRSSATSRRSSPSIGLAAHASGANVRTSLKIDITTAKHACAVASKPCAIRCGGWRRMRRKMSCSRRGSVSRTSPQMDPQSMSKTTIPGLTSHAFDVKIP